jgi:hypothetical protein
MKSYYETIENDRCAFNRTVSILDFGFDREELVIFINHGRFRGSKLSSTRPDIFLEDIVFVWKADFVFSIFSMDWLISKTSLTFILEKNFYSFFTKRSMIPEAIVRKSER